MSNREGFLMSGLIHVDAILPNGTFSNEMIIHLNIT